MNKVLFVIIFIASFLRLVHISSNPPSLSWDEVSIGYNAYSILKTGKDEHGTFMPFGAFAAFGDYKPPAAIYFTVPFVMLFGLSEVAVRLPSALFGIATVAVLYFLTYEMVQKKTVAYLSAIMLAITPWHITLSRAGFEANIALFFISLGVYFIIKAKDNPKLLTWSFLPFVIGIYTFNSTRYAGPLLAVVTYILFHKNKHKKFLFRGISIAAIALLPIVPHLLSKESRLRFNEVSIFTDLQTVLTSNTRREVDKNDVLSNIIHNRRIGYTREYFLHFFDQLEPRFLFVKGDGNPKFSIQDVGQLLIVTAPFVAIGFFAIFRDYPTIGRLLLSWLVISILPIAVARETPHALRFENALPVFIIWTAYGLSQLKNKFLHITIYCLLFTNFLYFWHLYMVHSPKEFSGEWQYGYKQAIEIAKKYKNDYDTIVLSENIGRPYIYALFYEKFDPQMFWKTKDASFDAAGFYNVYGFEKYRFTREGVGSYKGKTLYILSPNVVPENANIIETIRLLNGNPALVAFD